jgi:tetratricopeptide (TPR) repeat protein
MKPALKPFILALASCGIAAHAEQTVSLQGWHQASGPQFTIVSQMSVADTADWAERLGRFTHAMEGRLPGDQRLLGPFTLVLFSSRPGLFDAAPLRNDGSPSLYLGGFARSGGWGAIAATSERGSDQNTQRMVFQACVDWLLSADHRRRPRALTSGLNEVYGAYVTEGPNEIIGQPVQGWESRLRTAVNHPLDFSERFLSVEDLLAVKDINAVADRHGEPMFFIESWGFAHFLLFSKDMAAAHGMDKLLDAFSHHDSPHDALVEAFGEGAATINSRFHNYIMGGDFYEAEEPIGRQEPMDPPTAADPAAVAATLARLEAFSGRPDNARSYAEQAVQLAPGDVRAREALALADYRAHRNTEAAADLREAFRLNSQDGWTWYEASEVIGATDNQALNSTTPGPLTAEQARDAANTAEKAILLSKGIEAAYIRVASLMPVVSHVTEDDGKFLALGRHFFPHDAWIEIGHAQWARRIHDDNLALGIIGDVVARSREFTPEEVERARKLQVEWSAGRG